MHNVQCSGYLQVIDKRTRAWRESRASGLANDQKKPALQTRYGLTVTRSVAAVPIPLGSAYQADLTWGERWHLDFYRKRTAVRCSQYFQNSFWDGLVLQICEQHPAVRHAAIAISAHHYQREQVQQSHDQNRDSLLALHHSTQAITCLRESLARELLSRDKSSRTHKQVVLVACVILTTLALFQGDLSASRYHLVSGYRLFKEWNVHEDEGSTGLALRQLFAQIHVHWSICNYPELFVEDPELFHDEHWVSPNSTVAPPKIVTLPSSGIDQMHHVEQFVVVVTGLILEASPYGCHIKPASSIGRGAAVALSKLQLWRSRLMSSLIEADGLAPDDCDALKLIALWGGIIDIKLAVASSHNPNEMVYDDYLDRFQRIIKLAHAVAGSGSNDVPLSLFVYKASVLPALLWSGAKCRDWLVRRDICSLLDEWTGKDYWISATTLSLKRLVDVESKGVKQGDIIPEAARADFVDVKIRPEESKVELRYHRPQYMMHLENDCIRWESVSMYY
ncbi:hypothetical protein N7463_002177 [Penicillium fimorum]|uniref:Uncharacterized protein n=1 Tax=Penicillium fimorum TaxID=1882269 RepID=A0A9W9XZZ4_9EURO|nr:hypothetical protein N7463_002177 [Penicillium fimorum]